MSRLTVFEHSEVDWPVSSSDSAIRGTGETRGEVSVMLHLAFVVMAGSVIELSEVGLALGELQQSP